MFFLLINWWIWTPVMLVCVFLFYFMLFGGFSGAFCFRHFRFKARHEVGESAYFLECRTCESQRSNPKVRCTCGWNGCADDLHEYSFNEDTVYKYYCPRCDKEIKP